MLQTVAGLAAVGVAVFLVMSYTLRMSSRSIEQPSNILVPVDNDVTVYPSVYQLAPNRPERVPYNVVPNHTGFYSSLENRRHEWSVIGTLYSKATTPIGDPMMILVIYTRYGDYGPVYRVQNKGIDILLNEDRLYNGQTVVVPGLEMVGEFLVNNIDTNEIRVA
jgi:hypothetical protein